MDRPDDFETGDSRYLRPGDQRGDIPAARSGPAETRTREEYYEVLRAADGRAEDAGHEAAGERHEAGGSRHEAGGSRHVAGGSRHEAGGWDSVDASERPPPDALHVSDERRMHILDGDPNGGGGHRHGVGNPGKTEFPATWNDEKIIDAVLDVARRPDQPPIRQEWNHRWVARGMRDQVGIVVVIAPDGRIWTGWPLPGSPGVVKNPKEK